jgi:hypothetical protein
MNRKALIVANGRFEDPAIPPLHSPVPDGERLKSLLEREDVGAYQAELVADADHVTAKLAINAFFDEADPDDLLVLLLSGHGMRDRAGRLYFVARDTRHDALMATAVESRFITERAQDSIAARQVILVDTCHSGAFLKGVAFKSATAQTVDRDDFFSAADAAEAAESGKGRVLITASCERQLAQEQEGEDTVESVFTRTLMEGIANGDADPDGTGEITVDGLYKHVRRALARERIKQTPQYYPLGAVEGSLVVARNPAARIELPDEIKTKLAAPLPRDRAEAVDMLLALARGREVVLKRRAVDTLRELVADDSTLVATTATNALMRLGDGSRPDPHRQPEDQPSHEPKPMPPPRPSPAPPRPPEPTPIPTPGPVKAGSNVLWWIIGGIVIALLMVKCAADTLVT